MQNILCTLKKVPAPTPVHCSALFIVRSFVAEQLCAIINRPKKCLNSFRRLKNDENTCITQSFVNKILVNYVLFYRKIELRLRRLAYDFKLGLLVECTWNNIEF